MMGLRNLSLVLLISCVYAQNYFKIKEKEYYSVTNVQNEVTNVTIYKKTGSTDVWVVKGLYNNTYLKTGWDILDIETNGDVDDFEQARLAGYLEGNLTQDAIYDHYYNTVRTKCLNDTDQVCLKIMTYLNNNTLWIAKMLQKYGQSDMYWHQVNLFYMQALGIFQGYKVAAPPEETLNFIDIVWINFALDFDELRAAIQNETEPMVKGMDHCSALIKLLDKNSDILVSHNTWIGYEYMMRIVKRYTLRFHQVAGQSMSFPGYPGSIVSVDDFYTINSGLVVLETTIGNNNPSRWSLVQPVGQILEVIRLTVANRLADSGHSWAKIFSQYNSGTYNNQWMIVDMKRFAPGAVKSDLLWVLEQIPGYIHKEDQTATLVRQGYWASYNRPFYADVFNMSGTEDLVKKYGDFFTHDRTPRALLFKRDQGKVVDLDSMMRLMRSNDFQHDPLSRCNCTPPYSAWNAIAARSDLNPITGKYPFPTLGHRPVGATDAKVTSYKLSQELSFLAVCGPTTGTNLPPFQWSKSDFNQKIPHSGHPDLFSFEPLLISWPEH